MNRKLVNLARMHMAYLSDVICYGNPFGVEYYRQEKDYGSAPSDKQKCHPKVQHWFTIKGVKIMAASKKDAIKKYNHRKK